jgi:MFS family permease
MTSTVPNNAARLTDKRFSWRFTTPLFIGSALNPINSSMIATALVPIAQGLHVGIGQTASLVTALYLASAIAQPTAGKIAEVVGPRRVFLAGIVLVLLGGVLGGLSLNLPMLLIARVLIGLGTSCAYPSAMILIQRRARAAGLAKPPGGVLGGLQIAGIATASLGLPIGGVLVEAAGWRWVFFVNVPVALIALAAAAALFLALVLWELRAAHPFVDVRMLVRNGPLTRTYLRYALVALCVYVVLYGITQWLEAGRGISALGAGLLLLPMSVISGIVVAPISRRNLVRGPVVVAALATFGGAAGVLFLTSQTSVVWIVLITLLFGIALGTAASGNQTALYTQAPPDQLGVASGLFRTFGYVGSIASSAITGIVFHNGVSDDGVHLIALIMIGVAVIAVALSIFDRRLRSPRPSATPPAPPAPSRPSVTQQEHSVTPQEEAD